MTSTRRCSAPIPRRKTAAGNYKGGFGFHPLLCYLAETGEPLAGILRPGNAAAHTAADHFEVLALALEQLPAADLHREILARTDIGGRTHAFASNCRDAGIRFSVGYEVDERVREASALPDSAWQSAVDSDGEVHESAEITELGGRLDLSIWPEGTRLIVRRERPHPGAQLSVFDCEAGYRHTAFITDQTDDDIAALELRHRRRTQVEDSTRVGKDTGMRKMPFAAFSHNQTWLEISLLAQALLRWSALLCLDASSPTPSPSGCASACCTSPGGSSLRPTHDVAATALLAVGPSAGSRLLPAAGTAGRHRPIARPPTPPRSQTLAAPPRSPLLANGHPARPLQQPPQTSRSHLAGVKTVDRG